MCNLVGFSREKVNQIENGKTALIVKDLYSICYRLKVNPQIFFISKNDLDYYNQKFKIDAHSLIKYWRNDFSIIKNALDSFKARELTVTFNKFRRYSQKLFEKHPGLMVNEWTAKVGAIIGLYVGKERKYFQVGAFFSVKLFNDLYYK